MNYAEKLQRCQEYMEVLEEEKRKIQVFSRELPFCLELVTQAIEACRRELSGTTTEYMHGQSECSEQTSSDGPVLEEFIPIKRSANSEDVDEDDGDNGNDNDVDDDHDHDQTEQQSLKRNNKEKEKEKNNNDHKKKSDWLRSVQLWNQSPDPSPKEEVPRKAVVTEVKRNGGAFQPFHREKSVGKSNNNHQTIAKVPSSIPASATSSMAETVRRGACNGGSGSYSKEDKEKEGQAARKQRRCWSPELHRRFLHALQQLGGSHAATPKQIRELMKVDGLTNDEVKSHLQKYRLHTRRPSPATMVNNGNPQAPQFVVVGGIWVPPPEYAAMAAKTSEETAAITAANGVYAPVAAPLPTILKGSSPLVQKPKPTKSKNLQSERGSHSEEDAHSNSPATSSSTHTTTTSPIL